eukprot:354160-Chlamydomonas_euryale.AAC.1
MKFHIRLNSSHGRQRPSRATTLNASNPRHLPLPPPPQTHIEPPQGSIVSEGTASRLQGTTAPGHHSPRAPQPQGTNRAPQPQGTTAPGQRLQDSQPPETQGHGRASQPQRLRAHSAQGSKVLWAPRCLGLRSAQCLVRASRPQGLLASVLCRSRAEPPHEDASPSKARPHGPRSGWLGSLYRRRKSRSSSSSSLAYSGRVFGVSKPADGRGRNSSRLVCRTFSCVPPPPPPPPPPLG